VSRRLQAAALALLIAASPAAARFKLMPAGSAVTVAKSGLTITPDRAWNREGSRPGRNAESWTLDGLGLNDMTFYGGIADGKTLFREVDKKDWPLPRFSATMLAPDIAALFEGSYRVAAGTALVTIDSIAPARFAGHDGFRFTYRFTLEGEEVRRLGEATGAVIDGRLYLVSFEAPEIFYFARDVAAFRAAVQTARVVPIDK
jgi:hypothetical protein